MGFLGFPSFQHGLERILGEYIPRFSADNVRSRHGKKLFGALVEEGYLVVLIDRDDGLRLIAQDGIDVFLRIPRIFLGIGDGEALWMVSFTVNLLTSTGKTRNPISCAMLQM